MIIEMQSKMLMQSFGLNIGYIEPRQAYRHAHLSIGYMGSKSVDIYLHDWDEFVEKVQEADKVMQEAKQYYEDAIKAWEDREIAIAMKRSEQESDSDDDEDSAA